MIHLPPWRCSLTALLLLTLPAAAHPDPAHSLAELERHLAETPDNPTLHLHKAELLIRRKLTKAARPSVQRALALAPDDPQIFLLTSRLAHASGDLPQALHSARAATQRFPGHPPAWKWLAALAKQADLPEEALTAKLLHLSFPDSTDPGDYLTASTWLLDTHTPDAPTRALTTLDTAIARFGPLMPLQEAAIRIETSLSRHDHALARVSTLVAKYGPSPSASIMRVDIFEAASRHAEAAAACDAAIALLPQHTSPDNPLHILSQQLTTRKADNLRKAAK